MNTCPSFPPPPSALGRRAFLGLLAAGLVGLARGASGSEALLAPDQAVALVRQVSPLGNRILSLCLQEEGRDQKRAFERFDPAVFLRDRPASDLVGASNTMVHETFHYLCRVYPRTRSKAYEKDGSLVVFPDAKTTILVEGRPCPPARKAAPAFPGFLRDSDRFGQYVDSSDATMTTQQFGVFGLVEEFAAYQVGTRAAFDLVRHLLRRPSGTPGQWVEYLTGVDATVAAHQEFRGYVLAYMAFLQKQDPAAYRAVSGAPGFLEAWRAVNRSFGAVAGAWYRDLPGYLGTLRKAGIVIQTEGEFLVSGNTGRRIFRQDYADLEKSIRRSAPLEAMARTLG